MPPRTILITNNTLDARAGTELYVRDLALALRARGHRPVAFSTVLGIVARDLSNLGVTIVDDLRALPSAPDVIHGHHHLETMMALLRFPRTPAISVCHGSVPWEEMPPLFPRIRRYVAVDDACYDRLVADHQIPASRVTRIFNFVDLLRFRPRPPLPAQPARAAVLSNEISDANVLGAIREACAARRLELDVYGLAAGRPVAQPEDVLGRYDIVFARARSALEAMAVGAAVIPCGPAGLGSMVTTANIDRLRRLNFGVNTLTAPVTAEAIAGELARYDSADAAAVSRRIRTDASLDDAVAQWLTLYEAAIDGPPLPCSPSIEFQAAADYLRMIAPRLKGRPNQP